MLLWRRFYIAGTTPPARISNESYLAQYNRLQSTLNDEIMNAGEEDYNCGLVGLTVFTKKEWA